MDGRDKPDHDNVDGVRGCHPGISRSEISGTQDTVDECKGVANATNDETRTYVSVILGLVPRIQRPAGAGAS